MLPVVFDLARFDTILVGDGDAAAKRLCLLDEAGAPRLRVFSAAPSDALAMLAGARLLRRLPAEADLASSRLVFLSDRAAPYVAEIAALARAAGALLHIEDDPDHSDLHMSAVVRRGDLTIAVSTGGASPGLAVRLKRYLGELFGPEWQARTRELRAERRRWRGDGAAPDALVSRTDEWIAQQNWLPQSGALSRPRLESERPIRN